MNPVRLRNLWDKISASLWFVPTLMTLASVGLAAAAIWMDRRVPLKEAWFFLYSGGPEGARAVLATTAGSMITVAGVAFSVTMVALSFASSELGPRLLRHFMRDRANQVVLGTFIGTFVYCLFVLRTVTELVSFVPHIGVTIGLGLAMASLALLIYFIHHVAMSLQADYIIAIVTDELDSAIKRLYPGGMGEDPPPDRIADLEQREEDLDLDEAAEIDYDRTGYVHVLDVDSMMKLAREKDLLIRVLSRPGGYIHDGTAVAEVWPAGSVDETVQSRVRSAFIVGRTRTSQQDVEFAFRQLVEVAARALSPGVNDPFTANACIDRITTALLHLMRQDFPPRFRMDKDGELRVIAQRPDFAGVTDAAFHQIRQSGSAMPAVMIHLLDSLQLLLRYARTDEHRQALERHITLVRRAALRDTEDDSDRREVDERARIKEAG